MATLALNADEWFHFFLLILLLLTLAFFIVELAESLVTH
jgi:hypothetical protein